MTYFLFLCFVWWLGAIVSDVEAKAASFKITLGAPNSFQQTLCVTLKKEAELEIEEMCSDPASQNF